MLALASAFASALVVGIADCIVVVQETHLGIAECMAFGMAALAFGMTVFVLGMAALALGIVECN